MKKIYLKNKDCAKILYDLYDFYINAQTRWSKIKVPTVTTKAQLEKYSASCITKEEIWAYDNEIIFISDDLNPNRLEKLREGIVTKRMFLLMVAVPTYRLIGKTMENPYNEELDQFCEKNQFLKGISISLKEWLTNDKNIQIEEANKIIDNIEQYIINSICED